MYALKVRHGDMSDLAQYTPSGWFDLADGAPMRWLADHTPDARLLSFSVLRGSSLIELPFGLLAYLTLLNWLDPRLYRRLASPVVVGLMATSYSITFGLIEWALGTPYTNQNLVLRVVSLLVTVPLLAWLGRQRSAPPGTGAPRNAAELLAFAASAAALGYLVLALYDSVLLYSLGKAGGHIPGALVAGVVLAAARFAATRLRRRDVVEATGPGIDTLVTGLTWWMALFLVPALAIRYELGFGSRLLAAAAGLLVIGAATFAALRDVYSRTAAVGRWLLGLAVAVLAATIAAGAAMAIPAGHVESRLLRGAALFVLTATLVSALWDVRTAKQLPAVGRGGGTTTWRHVGSAAEGK